MHQAKYKKSVHTELKNNNVGGDQFLERVCSINILIFKK